MANIKRGYYDYKIGAHFPEVHLEEFDEKKVADFIKNIIETRKSKSEKIKEAIDTIETRKTALNKFKEDKNADFPDENTIKKNFGQGLSDSEIDSFVKNFNKIDIEKVEEQLEATKTVLETLYRRFNKDDVCIGIVGAKRIGKSTFIKSITGLSDAIVPTSPEGKPCTGVSSIIRNRKGKTTALITYYTMEEFEALFDEYKNAYAEKKVNVDGIIFGKQGFKDLYNAVSRLRTDPLHFMERLDEYYRYYDDIVELIRNGKRELTEESEITEKVAYTYGGKVYHDFLAVKKAEIFTEFESTAIENLTLIDTIGFGELSLGVDKKASEIVSFESDFVLLGNWVEEGIASSKSTISDDVTACDSTLGMGTVKGLQNIACNKWLFSVVNRKGAVKDETLDGKFDAINSLFPKDSKECFPAGNIDVSFIDKKEIKEKVIIPALQYISHNIKEIDEAFEKDAKESINSANECWGDFVDYLSTVAFDNNSIQQTITELANQKGAAVINAFNVLAGKYDNVPESKTIKTIDERLKNLETYIDDSKKGFGLYAILDTYTSTKDRIENAFKVLESDADDVCFKAKEEIFEEIKQITGLGKGLTYSKDSEAFSDFSKKYFHIKNQKKLIDAFEDFSKAEVEIGAVISTVRGATAEHLDPHKGNGNIPSRWKPETIFGIINRKLKNEQIIKVRETIEEKLMVTSPEQQVYDTIKAFLQDVRNAGSQQWADIYKVETVAKAVFADKLQGYEDLKVTINQWNDLVVPFENHKGEITLELLTDLKGDDFQ